MLIAGMAIWDPASARNRNAAPESPASRNQAFLQRRRRPEKPIGSPIEADFVDGQDFTTVRLNAQRETISIDGTSGAALSAAWILQSYLNIPLRIMDTEYSFDLILSAFKNTQELQTAIDKA